MADFGFTGEDVLREMRKLSPRVLMSFSTGKDSIGAALAVRDAGFEMRPFYMYQIPGNLEFIEESLDYYERTLFGGTRIIRLPHPSIARTINMAKYQTPDRLRAILDVDMQRFSAIDLQLDIIDWLGWPEDTLTVLGVRAADSQNRYVMFKRMGMAAAINPQTQKCYPIFDWNKDRLLGAIQKAGIKLPIDYRVFGKTFDGLDIRFLLPLKKWFPRDYERLLFWYPFADAGLFRHEKRAQT